MPAFDPQQLQEMMSSASRQYDDMMRKMQETVVEGSAGGGSVVVKMNGQRRVLRVAIDPEAMKSGDIEMLQDLVTAAFNNASQKVDESVQSGVGGMLGSLQNLL